MAFSTFLNREDNRGDKWALIVLILALTLFCSPLFRHPFNSTMEVDWNQLASVHLILKKTLLYFRQLPLWTPFWGGGYPLWAYPENDFLNPCFLILLPFNLWLSLKIRIWFYYVIGATGMYFLSRRIFRFNLAGAFFSASLFVFQSYLPFHVATGNLYMGSYYYLPWILYLFIKTPEGKKYLIATILLLTHLLIGATGLWMACLFLFLFLYSALEAIFRRPRFTYLRMFLLVVALVALLSAIRLLPLAELLQHTERVFTDYQEAARGSLSPLGLLRSLISPGPFRAGEENGLSRDEPLSDSSIYLGPLSLLIALWVLIFSWKKYRTLFFLLLIFSLLTMGSGSPLDLFRLLWHLPIFRSLHFPNKYFSPFIAFILALIAGEFFLFQRPLPRRRWLMVGCFFLGLGVLGHLFLTDIRYHRNIFEESPRDEASSREFFQVLTFWDVSPLTEAISERSIPLYHPGNLTLPYASIRRLRMDRGQGLHSYTVLLQRYETEQYLLAEKNIGKIYWYGWLYLKEKARPKYFLRLGRVDLTERPPVFYPRKRRYFWNPDWRGEAYLEFSRRPVPIEHFSPNHLFLTANSFQPDTLVVNQNFYPGWKTEKGKVLNHQGLLGVRLPRAGSYSVRLFYRPRSFILGAIISSLTLIAIFIWALCPKKLK